MMAAISQSTIKEIAHVAGEYQDRERRRIGKTAIMVTPRLATRKMVDAADHCIDAYSGFAAMVKSGGFELTEDWLADVLQDSLEMDWTSSDGARAIMQAIRLALDSAEVKS